MQTHYDNFFVLFFQQAVETTGEFSEYIEEHTKVIKTTTTQVQIVLQNF